MEPKNKITEILKYGEHSIKVIQEQLNLFDKIDENSKYIGEEENG